MVSITWLAFIGDAFATLLNQVGFVLQKLAHRDQEATQTRSKQEIDAANEDDTRDHGQTAKAYCSWRFALGLFLTCIGTTVHVVVLPYIDLTLMGCNASFGIIAAMILSTTFLGEKFLWKYDFTAFVFISAGCTTVVLNAHTEEVHFTA